MRRDEKSRDEKSRDEKSREERCIGKPRLK